MHVQSLEEKRYTYVAEGGPDLRYLRPGQSAMLPGDDCSRTKWANPMFEF
jgi:hypothetical protein